MGEASLGGHTAPLENANLVVQSAPFEIESEKIPMEEADASSHHTIVYLELDVKGVDYDKVFASEELKGKFAAAIQSGVLPQSSKVGSEAVALDISKGTPNIDGVPFVHVAAMIPVPPGQTAEETVAMFPEHGTGIGAIVQRGIRKIPHVELVSTDAISGPYEILVSTGELQVGGLRLTYATRVSVKFDIDKLQHAAGVGIVDYIDKDVIEDEVKDSLLTTFHIDSSDVVLTKSAPVADQLIVKATMTAHSAEAAELKVSDWSAKLLSLGHDLQKHFQQRHPKAVTDTDAYVVMVGIEDVGFQVDSVDLDFVAHGIDYSQVLPDRRKAFLTKFSQKVREAVNLNVVGGTAPDCSQIDDVMDEINVIVSTHGSDAVNIRVQIPTHEPADVLAVSDHLSKDDTRDRLKDAMKNKLVEVDGISFLSTWTPDAIDVRFPNELE